MKKQDVVIGHIAPPSSTSSTNKQNELIEEIKTASEAKRLREEEKIEKHSRLLRYLENKRLKEELDFIDKW